MLLGRQVQHRLKKCRQQIDSAFVAEDQFEDEIVLERKQPERGRGILFHHNCILPERNRTAIVRACSQKGLALFFGGIGIIESERECAVVLADAEVFFDELFEKFQGLFGVGHDVYIIPLVHRAAIFRLRNNKSRKCNEVKLAGTPVGYATLHLRLFVAERHSSFQP